MRGFSRKEFGCSVAPWWSYRARFWCTENYSKNSVSFVSSCWCIHCFASSAKHRSNSERPGLSLARCLVTIYLYSSRVFHCTRRPLTSPIGDHCSALSTFTWLARTIPGTSFRRWVTYGGRHESSLAKTLPTHKNEGWTWNCSRFRWSLGNWQNRRHIRSKRSIVWAIRPLMVIEKAVLNRDRHLYVRPNQFKKVCTDSQKFWIACSYHDSLLTSFSPSSTSQPIIQPHPYHPIKSSDSSMHLRNFLFISLAYSTDQTTFLSHKQLQSPNCASSHQIPSLWNFSILLVRLQIWDRPSIGEMLQMTTSRRRWSRPTSRQGLEQSNFQ
jgi:hypothetical protein